MSHSEIDDLLITANNTHLLKVIEYSKYHVDANKKVDDKPAKNEDDIKLWDAEFVKVDQSTLFDLILVGLFFVDSSEIDQGYISRKSSQCQTLGFAAGCKLPEY